MSFLSPEIQAKTLIANVRSATDDGPLILRLSRLIEAHEAQIRVGDREEQALGQVIDERDAAEEALSRAYYLVTGRSPEWSNIFGYTEALEEIEDACALLRKTAKATLGDHDLVGSGGEGWRLAPADPTPDMLDAARDWSVKKYGIGVGNDGAEGCWRAMLAAAPTPPSSKEGG